MPAGNPAGYLPAIKKRLKKAGSTPYKARGKRRGKPVATVNFPSGGTATRPGGPAGSFGTGGVKAPLPAKPTKTRVSRTAAPAAAQFIKPGRRPFDPAGVDASATSAQRKARRLTLKGRARTYKTTRGNRRLSFREAFLRRSTPSSRARVEALYGRKAGAKLRRQAEGPSRRYHGRSK